MVTGLPGEVPKGFDEALEYARRAGITDESSRFDELAGIYAEIEEELRSQYLVAYQSSNTGRDGHFRTVDLEVDRHGVEVKTLRGYYP